MHSASLLRRQQFRAAFWFRLGCLWKPQHGSARRLRHLLPARIEPVVAADIRRAAVQPGDQRRGAFGNAAEPIPDDTAPVGFPAVDGPGGSQAGWFRWRDRRSDLQWGFAAVRVLLLPEPRLPLTVCSTVESHAATESHPELGVGAGICGNPRSFPAWPRRSLEPGADLHHHQSLYDSEQSRLRYQRAGGYAGCHAERRRKHRDLK